MRALLVAGIFLCLPTVAVAGDKVRADKLFEEGRGYLQRKEYALACTAFEQSQQEDPAIGTQLNIALCYEEWGKPANAYRAYVEAEKVAKARKDTRAKHARKKINELEPKLVRLRVEIPANADPYSIFLFDGKQTDRRVLVQEQLLDPGEHTVEVRVAGAAPAKMKVMTKPGDRRSITLELPVVETKQPVTTTTTTTTTPTPPPPPPPPSAVIVRPRKKGRLYGGIGLAAGGAAAIGVASYVALIARSDYNDAIAGCPSNLCESKSAYDATQDARTRANIASVVTGAGVALVGVGVFLVLTSKGAPVKLEKVSARPLLTRDTIGLAIGGAL